MILYYSYSVFQLASSFGPVLSFVGFMLINYLFIEGTLEQTVATTHLVSSRLEISRSVQTAETGKAQKLWLLQSERNPG